MTDPEIKDLLGRALGEEPPLGIDREEVFRRGRKRLRTRRIFEAGGVVAAVVVAAVGAVLLTGLVGEPEKLPPAASTTVEQPAPPGPTLPLTPPTTGTTPPPSAKTPPHVSPDRADELYQALVDARVLDVRAMSTVPGRESLGFDVVDGNYLFEADVRAADGQGSLFVTVSTAPPGDLGGCESIPQPRSDCELRIVGAQAVAVATWWDKNTGEKRYLAYSVRPDGSAVTVISTNLTEGQRTSGQLPSARSPVLDRETVLALAALPGFYYG